MRGSDCDHWAPGTWDVPPDGGSDAERPRAQDGHRRWTSCSAQVPKPEPVREICFRVRWGGLRTHRDRDSGLVG